MADNSTAADDNKNNGLADQAGADPSISAFTSALTFNALVALGIFAAFTIVRNWNRKIYQPRTYLVRKDVRSPDLPKGVFSWITASFRVQDKELLDRVGLDAYMFLRFQRMSASLFIMFTLVAIPILLPINMVNAGTQDGLKRMTIGNILRDQYWRLWFHLIISVLFNVAAVGKLWREMQEYTRRRHAFMMSQKHAKTPQATTILVTAIPKGLSNEESLFNIFNKFPGGVKKIWLNQHPKELIKLVQERDELVPKLEMAEYQYIRSAYGKKAEKHQREHGGELNLVRPMGRVSKVPMQGAKVDLIDHYTERISTLNRKIYDLQMTDDPGALSSAFIQFHTQFGAHSAVQTVVHPRPFTMAPMFVEISPLDVVWDNMNLNIWIKKGRRAATLAISTGMILLWTFPVVFVNSIANLQTLTEKVKFLNFINDWPDSVKGIIQGILPPLGLAILMSILPIVLTILSRYEGHVRETAIMQSVMVKYFFFLVVNVLLLTTISGGFFNTWKSLEKDGFSFNTVVNMLASNLPGASTFFVTYAMLQGLTGPFLELLQIAPLVLNILFTKLLAKSPRQIWNIQGRLFAVNFGVVFPPQVLMFCIGILYSTMAPLILPFVSWYFAVYYFVYRHQFLYVYSQPVDSGGLIFPIAVKQTFTGIFISQVTQLGLFILRTDARLTPHIIITILMIIGTAFAFSYLKQAFNPLVTFLPVALFSKDLHVNENGVVTDGDEKRTTTKGDVESGGHHGEGFSDTNVMALTDMAPLTKSGAKSSHNPDVPTFALEKDNDASSSLQPAIPTRHPSRATSGRTNGSQSQPSYHGVGDKAEYLEDDGGAEVAAPLREGTISSQQPGIPTPHSSMLHGSSGHHLAAADGEAAPFRRRSHFYPQEQQPYETQTYQKSQHSLAPPGFQNYRHSNHSNSRWSETGGAGAGSTDAFGQSPNSMRPKSTVDMGGITEEDIDEVMNDTNKEELERMHDRAYTHPALYAEQQPVWLPIDERGLVQDEIRKLTQAGIVVATDGALLNPKTALACVQGIVYAPGEEDRFRLERGE
ncbi:hypothetical protein DFQ27_007568 [Actinomortierella ambigua]|uniref:DUF221-domain-containing protein n=1 Tax=Actinomortierella ambigua TaxID=1343610 RepID=A0A9P6UDE4_9FUNG|nr:hypothetical protein DFQ27_007568 [Actinomortierella ambigua]